MDAEHRLRSPRRFDQARGPQVVGTAVLAILTLFLGLRTVKLYLISVVPILALASGIRTPMLPPSLGLPVADGVSVSYWIVESVTAIVFVAGYWYWTHFARTRVHGRAAAFRRGWAGVVCALIAAHIVRATLLSLLSGEGLVSYALMLGGGITTALIVGLVLGLVIGAVCAAIGPSQGTPISTDDDSAGDVSDSGRSDLGVADTERTSAGTVSSDPVSPDPVSPDSAGNAASR